MSDIVVRNGRILNCTKSKEREKDWLGSVVLPTEAAARRPPVPPSVDLRAPAWWQVGNQGAHGACVGFATADALWWHLATAGKLPKSSDVRMSRRFVWMSAKETDVHTNYPTTFIEEAGTQIKAALDVLRKFGCVQEPELPFDPEKSSHLSLQSFFFEAAKNRITSYHTLRGEEDKWPAIESAWKEWLATRGPIVTRLTVDDTWQALQDAKERQGKLDSYVAETASGGHAVMLVGYTSDRFIVRNSWGKNWGDEGFAYASEEYAEAAFTEAYGIVL